MKPLVSIIIPAFNREKLIEETLDSVLNQTYQNWECIIVDDGSTDMTISIITKYTDYDQRFKFFQREREPKGASVCRNIGISKSLGEYVMFLDSDDLLMKGTLEKRIQYILHNPNNYSGYIFDTLVFKKNIGDDNRKWNKLIKKEIDLIRFLNQDMPWSISGPIWRRKSLIRFNEDAISFQDWEFHIRIILKNNALIKFEDEKCAVFYRKNNENDSISKTTFSKEQLLNRSNIIINIAKLVCNQKDIGIRFSLCKLLFRMANILIAFGLKKESKVIWDLSCEYNLISKRKSIFWWFYLINMSKKHKKIIEFIAFRIFKQKRFLNTETSFLSASEL